MRLQTVPEWYDFSCVSNTQAYKMLGNGWTVEVIAHLIRGAIQSAF
jgi:DNA (cytosine-5)-methyltransferase 3A